jgi:hypothetical protein
MSKELQEKSGHRSTRSWPPELVFAVLLMLAGMAALAYAAQFFGVLAGSYSWGTALFFLLLELGSPREMDVHSSAPAIRLRLNCGSL